MKILFVSRGDACRSVMACALARQVFGTQVTIKSVGVALRQVHPLAVAAMREINLDVSDHKPEELDLNEVESYDLIVIVESKNPFTGQGLKTQYVHWPLPDPLEPPADDEEVLARIKDTYVALNKHIKMLGKQIEMKLRRLESRP